MMQLKISKRGEIVIPKKIREQLGLTTTAMLSVHRKTLELRAPDTSFVDELEVYAKKHGTDVSKWTYGNKLYEEEF